MPELEHFDADCSFRLPDGARILVTYQVAIEGTNPETQRYIVRVLSHGPITWPDGQAARPEVAALVAAAVGKRAHMPEEAQQGVRLPLKYETLTGRIRYFFD